MSNAPTNDPTAGELLDLRGRVALRPAEAAAALGVSRRKVAELLADRANGFPRVKLAGVVLIPTRELADWLAAQTEGATR